MNEKNFIPSLHFSEIKLEHPFYRYPMKSSLDMKTEIEQAEKCLTYGYPQLTVEDLKEETLCVVGFGASLKNTWTQITHPAITTSGAQDFLIEKGFIPDYHVETDGRDHKVKHLEHPHKDVTYLMGSTCHPQMWENLKGYKVIRWHNALGQYFIDWIVMNDPNSIVIAGGSTVGLATIHIAGVLGYRKFKLFGFDACSFDGVRHAGPHFGPPQRKIMKIVDGNPWETSPQMYNAAVELIQLIDLAGSAISLEIVGNSLQIDLIKEYHRSWKFWDIVFAVPPFDNEWVREARRTIMESEDRRVLAKYNTGSIIEIEAVTIRAICEWLKPKRIVEIGTFLGVSTQSMKHSAGVDMIYTCDKDNDCLPATDIIKTHPYKMSTDMLGPLVDKGEKIDFFFFDGRIQGADLALIFRLSHKNTVYLFHDFYGQEKGVINVERMIPFLPNHRLITPQGATREKITMALLIPKDMI